MEKLQAVLKDYRPIPLGQQQSYAVFIPLVEIEGEWHLLYQVRSHRVSQPGEVAFPGGAIEPNETAQEAAIRETMEELGVMEAQITVFGEIDYLVYQERTIYCFVGQLHVMDWQTLETSQEVERLFTIPLCDMQKARPIYHELAGQLAANPDFPFDKITGGTAYPFSHLTRSVPFYHDFPETIWGMTAQFTHRLVEILSS